MENEYEISQEKKAFSFKEWAKKKSLKNGSMVVAMFIAFILGMFYKTFFN